MKEKRAVAICGLGRTDDRLLWQNRTHGLDAWALGKAALQAALDDWGGSLDAIDGLLVSRLPAVDESGRPAAVRLGLPQASLLASVDGKGRYCAPALLLAAEAVAAGKYRNLAIVYANDGRSRRQVYGGTADPTGDYGARFGFTSPGAWLGAAWRRYCHLYGADESALARLAVSARAAAARDRRSVPLPPLTEADYAVAPYVTEPLRKPDYCLVNDGAVCLILSREQGKKPPVWLRGGAVTVPNASFYTGEDFFYAPAQAAAAILAAQGWALEGESPDLLAVYDNFTPNVLFALEGFGLSRRGRAWQDVLADRLPPLNPNGGMLAGSYMQGWNLLHETALQLRNDAGERQTAAPNRAAYLCTAALVSALWLEREQGSLPRLALPPLPAEGEPAPQQAELDAFYTTFEQELKAQPPRLLLQRCEICGHLRCPPEICCPHCGSRDFRWQQAAGAARLWSWNRFHKAYFADFPPPYAAVLVKLAEGPVIISALSGAEPEDVPLDAKLCLKFEQGRYLFRPCP